MAPIVVPGSTGRLAQCAEERFEVVIGERSAPATPGWELAAVGRARVSTLPVGLITGWDDRLAPALIERHQVRLVVAKPYEGEDVIHQFAQVRR